jgi:hypothetical protein
LGFEQGGCHEGYSDLGFLGGIARYRSGSGDTYTVSPLESPVQYAHTLIGQDEQDAVLVGLQSQRCIPWTRNNATTGLTTELYIDGSLLHAKPARPDTGPHSSRINKLIFYTRHDLQKVYLCQFTFPDPRLDIPNK